MRRIQLHGTAIRLGGRGILLRGPSGSGKSSLALSALRRGEAAGLDACLVSDDQIFVTQEGDDVLAEAPDAIRGLIEVRGIGLLPETFASPVRLDLVVDLVPRETVARMPEPEFETLGSARLRRIRLPERDPGFGADILLTLARNAAFWNVRPTS
ncbi:HPr kinase/phosphatase C-terminal domain-containing protein [Aureimonas sp. ME7]|uniref:HPr kinase/phosphorylase n=1 Tax=Aureimonas sp. ME7 TaxID=2744252 RepID=UPI0015F623FA|nr:HPr kinase/phosphatase C-terminal domain-containing protein [Aureimonas sp. ME7]